MGVKSDHIDISEILQGTDQFVENANKIVEASEKILGSIASVKKNNGTVRFNLKAQFSDVEKANEILSEMQQKINTPATIKIKTVDESGKEITNKKINPEHISRVGQIEPYYKSMESAKNVLIEKWNALLSFMKDNSITSLDQMVSSKNQLSTDIFRYGNAFEALGGDISSVTPILADFISQMRNLNELQESSGNSFSVRNFKEIFKYFKRLESEAGAVFERFNDRDNIKIEPINVDEIIKSSKKASEEQKKANEDAASSAEESAERQKKAYESIEEIKQRVNSNHKKRKYDDDNDYNAYAVSRFMKWDPEKDDYITEEEIKGGTDRLKELTSIYEKLQERKKEIQEYISSEEEYGYGAIIKEENPQHLDNHKRWYEGYLEDLNELQDAMEYIQKAKEEAILDFKPGDSWGESEISNLIALIQQLVEQVQNLSKAFGDVDDESGISTLLSQLTNIGAIIDDAFSVDNLQIFMSSLENISGILNEISLSIGVVGDSINPKSIKDSLIDDGDHSKPQQRIKHEEKKVTHTRANGDVVERTSSQTSGNAGQITTSSTGISSVGSNAEDAKQKVEELLQKILQLNSQMKQSEAMGDYAKQFFAFKESAGDMEITVESIKEQLKLYKEYKNAMKSNVEIKDSSGNFFIPTEEDIDAFRIRIASMAKMLKDATGAGYSGYMTSSTDRDTFKPIINRINSEVDAWNSQFSDVNFGSDKIRDNINEIKQELINLLSGFQDINTIKLRLSEDTDLAGDIKSKINEKSPYEVNIQISEDTDLAGDIKSKINEGNPYEVNVQIPEDSSFASNIQDAIKNGGPYKVEVELEKDDKPNEPISKPLEDEIKKQNTPEPPLPNISNIDEAEEKYNRLNNAINNYIENQKKIESANSGIVNSEIESGKYRGIPELVSTDDVRQLSTTKSSIKRLLEEYLDYKKQIESGLRFPNIDKDFQEPLSQDELKGVQHLLDSIFDKLSSYVYAYKDMSEAAQIFGKTNADVFAQVQENIEKAKIANEANKKSIYKKQDVRDALQAYGIDKMTYGDFWKLEDAIKTGGIEAFAEKVKELFGVEIPTSVEKAKEAIDGVVTQNSKNDEISLKLDKIKKISDAYKNVINIQDQLNETDDGTQKANRLEEKLERAEEAVRDFKSEYTRLLVTMQDGSKVDIPLGEEFSDEADKILENAKEISDIKFITPDMQKTIDAYKTVETYIDRLISKKGSQNGKIQPGDIIPNTFEYNHLEAAERVVNNLKESIARIKTEDTSGIFGDMSNITQAEKIIAVLEERIKQIPRETEFNKLWEGISESIDDNTFSSIESYFDEVFEKVKLGVISAKDGISEIKRMIEAKEDIQPQTDISTYIKKSDDEIYSSAMEMAKNRESLLENIAQREIAIANNTSNETKKVYSQMANETYKLFKDGASDYGIEKKIQSTDDLIQELTSKLENEEDPKIISSLNQQLDEAKIKFLALQEVYKNIFDSMNTKGFDISVDAVEKYWESQRKVVEMSQNGQSRKFDISVAEEADFTRLTSSIKTEEDLNAAIEERRSKMIALTKEYDEQEEIANQLYAKYQQIKDSGGSNSHAAFKEWQDFTDNLYAKDLMGQRNDLLAEYNVLQQIQKAWVELSDTPIKLKFNYDDDTFNRITDEIDNIIYGQPIKPEIEQASQISGQKASAEGAEFDNLREKIEQVTQAIREKTEEIEREGQTVSGVVQNEISMFTALLGEVNFVITDLQTLSDKLANLPEINLGTYEREIDNLQTALTELAESVAALDSFFNDLGDNNVFNGFAEIIDKIKLGEQGIKSFAEILKKSKKQQEEALKNAEVAKDIQNDVPGDANTDVQPIEKQAEAHEKAAEAALSHAEAASKASEAEKESADSSKLAQETKKFLDGSKKIFEDFNITDPIKDAPIEWQECLNMISNEGKTADDVLQHLRNTLENLGKEELDVDVERPMSKEVYLNQRGIVDQNQNYGYTVRRGFAQRETVRHSVDENGVEDWAIGLNTNFESLEKEILKVDSIILRLQNDMNVATSTGKPTDGIKGQLEYYAAYYNDLIEELEKYYRDNDYKPDSFQVEDFNARRKKQSQLTLSQIQAMNENRYVKDWDAAIKENHRIEKQKQKDIEDTNALIEKQQGNLDNLKKKYVDNAGVELSESDMKQLENQYKKIQEKFNEIRGSKTSKVQKEEINNELKEYQRIAQQAIKNQKTSTQLDADRPDVARERLKSDIELLLNQMRESAADTSEQRQKLQDILNQLGDEYNPDVHTSSWLKQRNQDYKSIRQENRRIQAEYDKENKDVNRYAELSMKKARETNLSLDEQTELDKLTEKYNILNDIKKSGLEISSTEEKILKRVADADVQAMNERIRLQQELQRSVEEYDYEQQKKQTKKEQKQQKMDDDSDEKEYNKMLQDSAKRYQMLSMKVAKETNIEPQQQKELDEINGLYDILNMKKKAGFELTQNELDLMKSIDDSRKRASDQINAQNQLLSASIEEDARIQARAEAEEKNKQEIAAQNNQVKEIKDATTEYLEARTIMNEFQAKDIIATSLGESISETEEYQKAVLDLEEAFKKLEVAEGILESLRGKLKPEEFKSLSEGIAKAELGSDNSIKKIKAAQVEAVKNQVDEQMAIIKAAEDAKSALNREEANVIQGRATSQNIDELREKVEKLQSAAEDAANAIGKILNDNEGKIGGNYEKWMNDMESAYIRSQVGSESSIKSKTKAINQSNIREVKESLTEYANLMKEYKELYSKGIGGGKRTSGDEDRMSNILERMAQIESSWNEERAKGITLTQKQKDAQEQLSKVVNKKTKGEDPSELTKGMIEKNTVQEKAVQAYNKMQSKIERMYSQSEWRANPEKWTSEVRKLEDKLGIIDIDVKNEKELEDFLNTLKSIGKEQQKLSKSSDWQKVATDWQSKAGTDLSKWMNQNKKAANAYKKELKDLRDSIDDVGSKEQAAEWQDRFNKLQGEAIEKGLSGKSLGDRFKDQFKNTMTSLATYYLSFQDFIRYAREAISVIRELDTQLTEMRKVSDLSMKSLRDYQIQTFDIADKLGTTAVQIQSSTADWLRLGKSLPEAQEMASLSTKLLNVSEFTDINDATQALVSSTQAYTDVTASDIVDKLNLIGNNFAVSTDELAQGLQNAAAVLKTQGNDIDQTLALLTAGNLIGQDMSKSSAGIRTIALRISGVRPNVQ